MPVGRNCCSRMPEPDRYFKPRSVVAVVSQEGHGDARSCHLLGHAEAGYKKWKCMHSYQVQYEEIMEQLYYLSYVQLYHWEYHCHSSLCLGSVPHFLLPSSSRADDETHEDMAAISNASS